MARNFFFFFILIANFIDAQTTIYRPSNNLVQVGNQVQFAWNACEGATQYQLDVDINQAFSTPQTFLVSSTDTVINFGAGGYFLRVRCFSNGLWSAWSSVRNFTIIDLSSMGNLVLWLDAGDASTITKDVSNRVSSWRNKVNPVIAFNQANVNFQPNWVSASSELNSNPLLRFDGTDDFLNAGNVLNMGTNSTSFFLVGKSNLPSSRFFFAKSLAAGQPNRFALGHSGTNELTLIFHDNSSRTITTPNNINYRLYSFVANRQVSGSNAKLFSRGEQLGTTIAIENNTHDFSSTYRFLLGAYNNTADNGQINFLNGDIAEFIIYHSAISDSSRTLIEQYLRHKYTPPVNLGPDINITYSLCDTTLNAAKPWFTSYQWSNGATTPAITVGQSGVYAVTVTDLLGFQSSDTIEVELESVLTNLRDTLICQGDSVVFSAVVNFEDYIFTWHNNSSDSLIVINSTTDVFLVVADTLGCSFNSDTYTVTVDSFANQVSLGNDTSLCSGNSISLVLGDELVETYLWSTSDTSNSINVSASGNYYVELTNINGCIASDSINVVISGVAPVTNFIADTVCVGLATNFNNTSIVSSPNIISSSRWIIENDTIYSENTSYAFSNAGIYPVSLQSISDAGCESNLIKNVIVLESPVAFFQLESDTTCINNTYPFESLSSSDSTDSIQQYVWHFGDGQISFGSTSTHIYTLSNLYTIQLNITTNYGCQDSFALPLTVVDSAPQPNPSKLIFPSSNFTGIESDLLFSWVGNPNTYFYEFQIAEDINFNNLYLTSQTTDTFISVQNLPNQTLFWRVRSFNICNDFSVSAIRNFTIIDLSSMGNLVLWLDAGDASTITKDVSNRVSSWRNKVNPVIAFNQANVNFQPNWVSASSELNSNPLLRFDGTDDFLNAGNVLNMGTNSTSFFLVGKSNLPSSRFFFAKSLAAGQPNRFALGHTATSELSLIFHDNASRTINTPNNTNFRLYSFVANRQVSGSNAKLFSRGEQLGTTIAIENNTHDFSSTYRFLLGAYNNTADNGQINFLNGDIAEFIIYHSAISDSSRTLIEQYLRHKYTPPVNLGPDINITYSLCDTTLNAAKPWFTSYTWSGPNGFVSASESISTMVSGTYSVTVTDVFGYESSDAVNVTIPQRPSLIDNQFICIGFSQTYDINIGNNYQYVWNGNDTTSILNTSTAGTYFYSILDTLGCVFSDTFLLEIDSFEQQMSIGSDTTLCSGNTIAMVNSGNYPISTYNWSTGETTDFATISSAGNYSLTATNINGCQATDFIQVSVIGDAPLASFTYSDTCANSATNFEDLSTVAVGNIVSWQWDFGDGNTATSPNPTNVFDVGFYTVQLTVGSNTGCFNHKQQTIEIKEAPAASFFYPIACAQTNVAFSDASTPSGGSVLTSWQWESSDGQNSNVQNPTGFVFQNSGVYQMELTVTNSFGCKNTKVKDIEIFPALVPDFTYENYCAGDSVSFMDATPSFSIVEWLWSFGLPNAFSFEQNPKQRYNNPGFYTVNLKVTNAIGCESTVSKIIDVKAPPLASIGNDSACLDDELFVFSTSQLNNDPVVSYVWTLNGDTLAFMADSLLLMFEELGTYEVAMYIQTESGCEADATKTITVYEKPTANFRLNPTYGVSPQPVQFTNLSQDASSYFWDFGDGTGESNAVNPIYTYLTNGVYTIVLQAINENGCSDFFSREIPVIPSELDIELRNLQLSTQLQPDGSLKIQPTVQLVNVGTRVIENAELHLRLDGQVDIVESWSGSIPTAGIAVYTFSTFYSVSAGYDARYVCVEAKNVNDGSEENLSNNRACKVLQGQIQISNPYPNPATNLVNIDLITESAGNAALVLYEVSGKKVIEVPKYPLERGLNKIQLDLRSVFSGEYYLKISYLNEDYVKPLVISNK
jgi:PKD repeat protein